MTPLSNFEKAFIAAIAESDLQRELILGQLHAATVASREYTGVGLYTKLLVPASAPRLDQARWKIEDMPKCWGEHPDVPAGAGFILWVKDGFITCLESYTYDGSWPANEDLFKPAV